MVAAADIRRTAHICGQSYRDRREIPLAGPRGKHEAIGMGWRCFFPRAWDETDLEFSGSVNGWSIRGNALISAPSGVVSRRCPAETRFATMDVISSHEEQMNGRRQLFFKALNALISQAHTIRSRKFARLSAQSLLGPE